MARILVTGGTGFVGASLINSLLDDGHTVTVLGRDAGRIRLKFGSRAAVALWADLEDAGRVDKLACQDAIVNLAGAQAVGTRFTPGSKQQIRDSRVKTTRQLVQVLQNARQRPPRFVSASAVGYYGPQMPGRDLDEMAPGGTGFLAELCHEWESAALQASGLGISTAIARLGVVFGAGGGAFDAMARPFRIGLGGPIGNGRQDVSFVSLKDCIRALRRLIEDESIEGPVNVVAPNPVTSRELARALARAMGRPNWLPVPATALRLLYGEGADALLTGQRAIPRRLIEADFKWMHPTVEAVISDVLACENLPTST